jgi:hypothetical protein
LAQPTTATARIASGSVNGIPSKCPTKDLLGRSIIDLQSPGLASGLDTESAQTYPVIVDSLARVTDNEQVVLPRRHGHTKQPPLRWVQVLGLVDNDVIVWSASSRR